jgi:hypothetical protein
LDELNMREDTAGEGALYESAEYEAENEERDEIPQRKTKY